MADISPQVISKLSQVMFSKNEPPVTSVIWARPQGGSKRSYAFLVFTEGRWQSMSSGGDIPKDISYFNNDVGYITMDDLPEFSPVAYSGDYTDLINTPTIPAEVTESTVAGWGFTKNTGTYSKPSGGIPSTDMSSDVQTSLGKADTALQTETDPTVPSWAKQSSKPSYTASEVGALPDTTVIPDELKDLSDDATHRLVTDTEKATWNAKGSYSKPSGGIPKTDLASAVQTSLGKADTALQSFTETDPTVPSWAKASSKPSYTASEVGALPDDTPLFSGDYNDLSNKPNIPDVSNKEDVTPIVAKSTAISTLTAEVGKYYRFDVPVGTLTITLPTMADTTTAKTIVFYLTAGTTPAVTFSSTHPVYYSDGFEIAADSTYEVNALWNGVAWVVASVKIVIPT